jgi:hypothetical protein
MTPPAGLALAEVGDVAEPPASAANGDAAVPVSPIDGIPGTRFPSDELTGPQAGFAAGADREICADVEVPAVGS